MRRVYKTINKKGFTLSELLVSIAIMSFVAIGAVGGIALIFRMHKTFEQKNTASLLLNVTEQNLSRSLNRQDGVTLVGENTGTPYHITVNGVPLIRIPDANVEDGTYITVDNFLYSSDNKTYEYDLVVNSENDSEIMRQHIFVHISAG